MDLLLLCKGPQRKWLHRIQKKDTPGCHCHRDREQPEQPEQSGEHLVEGCRLLAEARELVEKSELRDWRTRHSRNQPTDRKKKGPVEPAKEKEKEEDKLELFFCHLYEFHNPVPVPIPVSLTIPVFPFPFPASPVEGLSVISSVSSVVPPVPVPPVFSSVNSAVPPVPVQFPPSCIGTTQ